MSRSRPLVEYSCQCEACIQMCVRCPCLGTPKDIQRILGAGLEKRMYLVRVHDVKMIAPKTTDWMPRYTMLPVPGVCTFLRHDGKCELHDKGLKPLEGRVAIHNDGEKFDDWLAYEPDSQFLRKSLARSWSSKLGQALVQQFWRKYGD